MKLPRFDEEAVSPVIGVILMVAIVVILAAVVWVAVAPMADENLQSAKILKITGKMPNSSAIEYIVVGGSGLNQVNTINYSINGTNQSTLFTDPAVGEITSITAAKGDRVVLIGLFDDGTEQIIDDRTY